MIIRLPWERERRNRICVAVYAYAYELRDEALITDNEYDRLARSINVAMRTGNDVLDRFFATRYSADTGMWIYEHPDINGIGRIYERYYIQ